MQHQLISVFFLFFRITIKSEYQLSIYFLQTIHNFMDLHLLFQGLFLFKLRNTFSTVPLHRLVISCFWASFSSFSEIYPNLLDFCFFLRWLISTFYSAWSIPSISMTAFFFFFYFHSIFLHSYFLTRYLPI